MNQETHGKNAPLKLQKNTNSSMKCFSSKFRQFSHFEGIKGLSEAVILKQLYVIFKSSRKTEQNNDSWHYAA